MSYMTLLLTKNHEDILLPTLESIKSPILIGDLGSKDGTVELCKKHGAQVFHIPFQYNYSAIRNTLMTKATTDWLFWLEPGEEVISGHEYLDMEKTDAMYRVMIVKEDLLVKQPRLIRKGTRFIRPVFEDVEDVSEQTLPLIISGETRSDTKTMMECLIRWQDQEPFSPEPDYYLAFLHLMCKRYDQFLNIADQFLFKKKTTDASVVLTKYYMANFYRKKNVGKALQLILECIAAYPLMAEFWCFLGDLYLISIKEYERAYLFYENAIILGSRRLAEDVMPMEISKYDEYPRKMMEGVRHAIQKTLSGSSNEGSGKES